MFEKRNKIFSKNLQIIIFNPFLTRVERCRARANTSFRFEGARITLLQFCAGLQSACTIAENSESVRKLNLTAKISFVLAYRALVPLYKTQNQIHPAAHGSHYYSFVLVYRALVPLQKTQNQ